MMPGAIFQSFDLRRLLIRSTGTVFTFIPGTDRGMGLRRYAVVPLALAVVAAAACGGPGVECQTDDDCPTGEACISNGGVLFADHICAPLETISPDAGDTTSDTVSPDTRPTDTSPPDTTPTDTAAPDPDTSPNPDVCVPETEKCNGRDDDCDETIDEGCDCSPDGKTVDCYPAADPSTEGVGICTAGQKTCRSGSWGECEGVQTPLDEVCGDGDDNDCDGTADEDCSCNYKEKMVGVCAGQMKNASGTCVRPTTYEEPESQGNDGLDNDCDDAVDEGTQICDHAFIRMLGSPADEEGDQVAIDGSGNVYIVGDSKGQIDGETTYGERDTVLAKYDDAGNLQWFDRTGSGASDIPAGVAVGPSGDIFVVGASRGDLAGETNQGSYDVFLSRYAPSGTRKWITFLATGAEDVPAGLAVAQGHLYFGGHTRGAFGSGNTNQGGRDVFVTKYSRDGEQVWIEMLGSPADERLHDVTADGSGNVYVGGETDGALGGGQNRGGSDALLASWDASGNRRGVHMEGTPEDDAVGGVAATSSGRLYATGNTEGDFDGETNAGGEDVFLMAIEPDGSTDWVRLLGSAEDEDPRGVALDDHGGAVVTGNTKGELGGWSHSGGYDIFIARYAPSGDRSWMRLFGGTSADGADGIATGGTNAIYVTGESGNDLGSETNVGENDFLLMRAR